MERLTHADLHRIAFVTRRFESLHGLRTVSYGACLLVGVLAYDYLPEGSGNPIIHVVLFAQLLSGMAARPVGEYYRRCYGRVTSVPQREFGRRPVFSPGQTVYTIVAIALMVDVLKAAVLPGSVTRISVAGAALIAASLWIVVRDWPHRAHYVIPLFAGAAAIAIVASAPVRRAEMLIDPAVDPYYVVACGVIGLALLAAGLLDHFLLARAMWRPQAEPRPAQCYLGGMRATMAGTVLSLVAICIAMWGWPPPVAPVSLVLWTMVLWPTMAEGFRVILLTRKADEERTRAREAALLARFKRSLGQAPAPMEPLESDASASNCPTPDFLGHVILPLGLATGALVDAQFRGAGYPSFMAIGLAASHARIAWRDWPVRKHYITGTIAALTCAGLHIGVDRIGVFEWAVLFLALVSAAMLVEGLLDRRLESGTEHPTPDREHAHTI